MLSGQHEVEFIVALDDDDERSIDYFAQFGGVTPYIQPRPIGVGDVWNRAARAFEADFYVALPDDAWIITPGWDAMMVHALTNGIDGHMAAKQLGIFAFYDPEQPTIASIFGMAKKWIDANGFVFDPRYPFWFADNALCEVAVFATGEGMPGTTSLKFASRPGNVNPRLRDLEFWWAFHAATRWERVETGRKIAKAAGLPIVDEWTMAKLVGEYEGRDAVGIKNAPAVLASITNPLPPSPQYLEAKRVAESYLQSGQFGFDRVA